MSEKKIKAKVKAKFAKKGERAWTAISSGSKPDVQIVVGYHDCDFAEDEGVGPVWMNKAARDALRRVLEREAGSES